MFAPIAPIAGNFLRGTGRFVGPIAKKAAITAAQSFVTHVIVYGAIATAAVVGYGVIEAGAYTGRVVRKIPRPYVHVSWSNASKADNNHRGPTVAGAESETSSVWSQISEFDVWSPEGSAFTAVATPDPAMA